MPAAHDTDAMTLLDAMARTHPEPTDLTFESWELGFSSRRMERALGTLAAIDCVTVEPAVAPTFARHAHLTAKGLELARSQGLGAPEHAGNRRRGTRDRRLALVSSPPPGQAERRHAQRDRRGELAA